MRQQMTRLLPVVALIFAAVLLRPVPAFADALVTATPGTVNAGKPTTVRAACGSDATSATLSTASFGGSSQIAMGKDAANGPGAFRVTITVPNDTLPGTYDLSVTCNTGETGVGTLMVASTTGPATGGGSTSTGVNRNLLIGGVLLLMVATGAVLIRRRRSTAK